MRKSTIWILIVFMFLGVAEAAQKPVVVGTSTNKASLDSNFSNTHDNFTELYYVNTFEPYSTVSALLASSPVLGGRYTTQGYYAAGDGGGAEYLIVAGNSGDGYCSHNIGSNTAILQTGRVINAMQCGAKNNGTDSTAAITAAIAKFDSIGQYAGLYFPAGSYVTTGITVTLDTVGTKLFGDGKDLSRVQGLKIVVTASDVTIENIFLLGGSTPSVDNGIGISISDPTATRRRTYITNVKIFSYDIGIYQDDNGALTTISHCFLFANVTAGVKYNQVPYMGRGDSRLISSFIYGSEYGVWLQSCGGLAMSGSNKIQNNGINLYMATVEEQDNIRQVFVDSASIEDASGTSAVGIATFADGGTGYTTVTLAGPMDISLHSRATISGTTNYDGLYFLYDVNTSAGTFKIKKAFNAAETSGGIFTREGWDVVIWASEAAGITSINDIFFTNGDTNNVLIRRGSDISFMGGTIKRSIWVEEATVERLTIVGGTHTESASQYVPISGGNKDVYVQGFNGTHYTMSYVASGERSMADNTAISIDTAKEYGMILIMVEGQNNNRSALLVYNTVSGSAGTSALVKGSAVEVGYGALTGTTGADDELNVYSASDGKVYIENRLGATYIVRWVFLT